MKQKVIIINNAEFNNGIIKGTSGNCDIETSRIIGRNQNLFETKTRKYRVNFSDPQRAESKLKKIRLAYGQ